MSKPFWLLAGSAVVVMMLITALASGRRTSIPSDQDGPPAANANDAVQLFCAASNRAVIESVIADYRRETGREVVVQYGASQTLLSQIQLSRGGDLYLPADDSFLDVAVGKGLIAERFPIATMRAGIAVRRDHGEAIESVVDLADASIRLVQASPEASAIGRVTRRTLELTGDWAATEAATDAFRGTVNEVANDVLLGAADAGIVYDAVLHTYPDLIFVSVPELAPAVSRVAVGVLEASDRPNEALHLARFITATDRGIQRYLDHGFDVEAPTSKPRRRHSGDSSQTGIMTSDPIRPR